MNVRNTISIDEYIHTIVKQTDISSIIELLDEGPEKELRKIPCAIAHENSVRDLFYSIFVSPRANADFIKSLHSFIENETIPVNDKCMLISAITLNIMQRFDAAKVLFLLDVCRRHEAEISARAITVLFQFSAIQQWHLIFRNVGRLKLRRMMHSFPTVYGYVLGFIQAHETEKIRKR